MKKGLLNGLSLLLIFAILCPVFGLTSYAGNEEPLSVNVIADAHFNPLSSVPDVSTVRSMPESVLYSHASYNAQLYAESEAVLAKFLADAAAGSASVVLVAGDLVDGAQKASHIEFARRLADFENRTGKRVFVINGNNDISLNNPSCASNTDFAEIYADFGYGEALNRDPSSLSYTVDLDSRYRLIAIDSCNYGVSPGDIEPSVMQWIREQVQTAKSDNKHLVAMMHHALLKHYGGFGDILLDKALNDDRINNADAVLEEFADLGIQYVFTGHMHANSITKDTSEKGNEIYDIETNCLVTYPCSYRTVTFSDENVDVKTQTIGSIDLNKLPAGYTGQQLDLIQNNFRQYAYGYIAVSAKYMLKQYLVYPQNTINRIGLDSESELAKLLTEMLPDMYNCFSMPLYKTVETNGASIEEIAASGGYTLPASGYSNFFEVLNVIVGEYTCGDADMPGTSLEVRLLLDCIKAVLVYALGNNAQLITPEVIKEIIELTGIQLPKAEKQSGLADLLFRQNLVNRLIKSLAIPFMEGVTKDAFPPGDVNVILPAYADVLSQNPLSFFDKLFEFIKEYFEKLWKMFTVFIAV